MTHELNNTVIKSLTPEHGAKIIEWWKSNGVNTNGLDGSYSEAGKHNSIYYGLFDGVFGNLNVDIVRKNNMIVIELPTPDLKRGDWCMVWDGDCSKVKRIFVTKIEGAKYPHIVVIKGHEEEFIEGKPFHTSKWEYCEPLQTKTFTLDQAKDIIAKVENIDKDNIEISA